MNVHLSPGDSNKPLLIGTVNQNCVCQSKPLSNPPPPPPASQGQGVNVIDNFRATFYKISIHRFTGISCQFMG